jgi:chemotaxis protein histidine kinase CheA
MIDSSGSSGVANPENKPKITSKVKVTSHFFLYLKIGVVITTLVSVIVGWQTYSAWQNLSNSLEVRLSLSKLQGEITYYDELLTMSARLNAATGDSQWEKRYNDAVPKLDKAIQDLIALTPVKQDAQAALITDNANKKLIDLETASFELTKQKKNAEALKLLLSGEYSKWKNIYNQGSDDFNSNINSYVSAEVGRLSSKTNKLFVVSGIVLLITTLSWVFVIQLMKNLNTQVTKLAQTLQNKNETILKNVSSGLFLIDKNLMLLPEFSKSCEELFGKERFKSGESLLNILGFSKRESENYEFLANQVFEDILPEDMSLDQLPSTIKVGEKFIHLQGSVVRKENSNQVSEILFTATDATEAESAKQQAEENSSLVKILSHKNLFQEFLKDFESSCTEVTTSKPLATVSQLKLRSLLHTWKGNCHSFGMSAIAKKIHDIESKTELSTTDVEKVQGILSDFLIKHHSVLDMEKGIQKDSLLVSEQDINSLWSLSHSLSFEPALQKKSSELQDWISKIIAVPFKQYLPIFDNLKARLVSKLSRDVNLVIQGEDVTIMPKIAQKIIPNLGHLIRNSFDHGFENFEAELETRKQVATVWLSLEENNTHWNIKIKDNGKGIQRERLVEKAIEKGLIPQGQTLSEKESIQLIFCEGLSSAETVSEISGRGIGMSAVAEAVRELGGTLNVMSEIGQGTEFEIYIPKDTQTASLNYHFANLKEKITSEVLSAA